MLGLKEHCQLELCVSEPLRQLIPDEHLLARVDRVLDLSWLRGEVGDLFCADKGWPGVDPEAVVRLMLDGFLLGIVHDRRPVREARAHLAIHWFAGYPPKRGAAQSLGRDPDADSAGSPRAMSRRSGSSATEIRAANTRSSRLRMPDRLALRCSLGSRRGRSRRSAYHCSA